MALTDNLQGYWKFDESSGNPADSSGNGYTLTNNNTATFATGKINNGAVLASASTQYFSRTDANVANLDFAATDFTLNGWVNWTSAIPASGTVQSFMGKFDSAARQYLFSLYNIDGSQIHLISEIGDGASNASQQDVSWTPSAATWYMVTLRYTTSTKASDFSVNASAQGATQTGTVALGNGSADFRVGSGFGAGGRLMNGSMDEWGAWNRRLSDAELTTLYNGGSGLQYPFSSTPATTTTASSNLTLLGVG